MIGIIGNYWYLFEIMQKFRPGVSFSDFLVKDSATKRSRVHDINPKSQVTIGTWAWLITTIAMGLLVMRLGSLQILQGGKYRVLAEENRVQKITLPAPRGIIFDRSGTKLADNILKNDRWERVYPLGPSAAHVVGYVGETSENEVGLLKSTGGKYELKDAIGRVGIEQQYESVLRGVNGGRLVEVNSNGSLARELGHKGPISGQDLHLTIDARLQQVAGEALNGKKGAVVASNPKTGEIYVLASGPSYDPLDLGEAVIDNNFPLLNRAIGGVYPPASTFKMITMLAGLTDGKLPKNYTYVDTGIIRVGTFSYTNWFFTQYGGVEGEIGWSRALARSTDTFFYKVGELTGAEDIAKWATNLGLGNKTGIDLPGEVAGLVPTPNWKKKIRHEQWYLGNTYHLAIGQDDILATPLQINNMTSILASGGLKCKPHLTGKREACDRLEVDADILKIIKDGMLGACSPGGTAFPLFNFVPQVACKTGTAEYMRPDGKIGTHAWLTAYAPADDPTISVTALVEAGGEGSRAAAPIVRKILVKYFGVEDNFNYTAISGLGE